MMRRHVNRDRLTFVDVTEKMLLALLIVLTVPYLIWRLARTDDWAPLVVVQILVGIVLGPGVLGVTFPDAYRTLFDDEVIAALSAIATWGVVLFVWVAGVELDLRTAWESRRDTVITAFLALGMPLISGALLALLLMWHSGTWIGPDGQTWQFVAGIGMACAVTALPILMLLMDKIDILRRPLGQRVLRYASLDDIAIWGVLAIILVDIDRLGRQVAFIAAFVLLATVVRRHAARIPEPDRWFLALSWLTVCALASDWAGLHYMVGAFLAGVVIDRSWLGVRRLDDLRHTLLLILMPVFFLITGLRTEWTIGGTAIFVVAAAMLIAAVTGKLAGVGLAGRLLGWPVGEARIIGWLLQTKGLIMIIFANVLVDQGIISAETFTALLLMAIASTMLTIPMVRRSGLPQPVSRTAGDG